MRIASLFLVLVAVVGCGDSPAVGAPCETVGALACADATTLLSCEGGAWLGFGCPSCADGRCDWKGVAVGGACPRAAATYGTCNYDGRLIGCYWSDRTDAGTFVEGPCAACSAGHSIEELGRCGADGCSCQ